MRSIRISDEVWSAIASRGKFGETEDDVLRREFGIDEAAPSSSAAPRVRPRYATDRMSTYVEDDQLHVSFKLGATKSWPLPSCDDKEGIRIVRSEATEWATDNGASPGQVDAVKKALTSAGYHLRR